MSGPANGLILGIDPGLAGTGFALLSGSDLVLACSTLTTGPGRDGTRLLAITRHLRGLLSDNPPAEASLEELFMGRNATVLEECGVPVFEYKPSQVKMVLTGYGNADKAQIARMLGAQVKVPEGKVDAHAMDAIAIAVCHARSRRMSRVTG
ncbi:MAG: crossover junction endodeoxyribonuclease RuvC [Chloroflexi bacterium]|nr:MAG: crossover junction endodeoxyribonuclease RuvC [Chloroflexota bacterium]